MAFWEDATPRENAFFFLFISFFFSHSAHIYGLFFGLVISSHESGPRSFSFLPFTFIPVRHVHHFFFPVQPLPHPGPALILFDTAVSSHLEQPTIVREGVCYGPPGIHLPTHPIRPRCPQTIPCLAFQPSPNPGHFYLKVSPRVVF